MAGDAQRSDAAWQGHGKDPAGAGSEMTYFRYSDPAMQAVMILDEVRTAAYAEAISKVIGPADVVLDVGAGSGILSILAAKAGARKVYALERTGMVELLRDLARENRVSERIEVIRADLEEMDDLGEPATILISEMLGHFAHDEDQHRLYQRALRLCSPNARTIPQSYQVGMAAARPREHDEELELLTSVAGVSMQGMVRRLRERVSVRRVGKKDLVGDPAYTASISVASPTPDHFGVTCAVSAEGPVTAIVASFRADLANGVLIDTGASAPETHWKQVVFPIYPALNCEAGDAIEVDLWPRVSTNRGTWNWRVSCKGEVREGDAMNSYVGDKDDMLAELGLKRTKRGERGESRRLREWAAMLGGDCDASADEMAGRLQSAFPERFDAIEARQEVLRFLDVVAALR